MVVLDAVAKVAAQVMTWEFLPGQGCFVNSSGGGKEGQDPMMEGFEEDNEPRM